MPSLAPKDSSKLKKSIEIKATTRRFILQRNEDVSGMSGTGIVAEGVEFQMVFVLCVGQQSIVVLTSTIPSWSWKRFTDTVVRQKVVWIDK
jgi:hypothetical protein